MSEKKSVPIWFWIVTIIALIWNLMGVMNYIGQVTMSPEALAALPESQQTYIQTVPSWAVSAFAIAVFGGAFGCLLLLFRKKAAIILLAISLLGILVQMFHAFFMSGSTDDFGPGGFVMPIMIIGIGVFLVWLSKSAKNKGWIS